MICIGDGVIVGGDIDAIIVGIVHRRCGVYYEIAWFHNGERRVAEIAPEEISSTTTHAGGEE